MRRKTVKGGVPDAEGRDGGILLLVLLVMLVLTALGGGLIGLGRADALETAHQANKTKAFWMAEAGLTGLKAILAEKANYRKPLDQYGLVGSSDEPVLRGGLETGSYEVFVTLEKDLGRIKFYDIQSVGKSLGGDAVVKVGSRLRLSTGSGNVWTTNSENGPSGGMIWFVSGDKFFGSTHSNDRFNVMGIPVFSGGLASSAASGVNYYDGTDSSYINENVFQGGLELGAAEYDFDPFLVSSLKDVAALVLADNKVDSIEFIDGARYVVSYQEAGWRWMGWRWEWRPTVSVTNSIANLGGPGNDDNIIFVKGDVEVKGEVGGTVSIAASGTITITDDLVYSSATANRDHSNWAVSGFEPDENEVLGLFSKKKVQIRDATTVNNWWRDDGDANAINIHASIFVSESNLSSSENPGFGVENYNSIRLDSPYINLYGSIMQYYRGAVGTTAGTGYLKNYRNDSRFRLNPPPGAPYASPEFSRWAVLR